MKLTTTAFDLAQRFVGIEEVPGRASNPHVLAMLRLDSTWPVDDEIPWCSAFANYVAWLLRLPRSKSLAARSWLGVGRPIGIEAAEPENDMVILKRGVSDAGPEVRNAAGHVGFFAGLDAGRVLVLGGNQGDMVSVVSFDAARLLGVRRLT
jgi:uncharacterized protein (TIGR02594 family)